MALLVYSDRCHHSIDVMTYIKTQPALLQIVRFHNINTNGIPSKRITRVPTLVTNEGSLLVGGEVRNWLESMVPVELESWCDSGLCTASLGEPSDDAGAFFDIKMYGVPLQPVVTPEMHERINRKTSEAFQEIKR